MDKQEARRRAKEHAGVQACGGFALVHVPIFGGYAGYDFTPVSGSPSGVEHLSPDVEEWWLWNEAQQQWKKQRLP